MRIGRLGVDTYSALVFIFVFLCVHFPVEDQTSFPKLDSFDLSVLIKQKFEVPGSRGEIVDAVYKSNRFAKMKKGNAVKGVHKTAVDFELEPPGLGTVEFLGTKWTRDTDAGHEIFVYAVHDKAEFLYRVLISDSEVKYWVGVETRQMPKFKTATVIRTELKKSHDRLLKHLKRDNDGLE